MHGGETVCIVPLGGRAKGGRGRRAGTRAAAVGFARPRRIFKNIVQDSV